MSKEDIVSVIKEGKQAELTKIYTVHRHQFIVWFVNRYGCTTEEAKELYQKTFLSFYESVLDGKIIALRTNLDTLLIGIGKNVYKYQKRRTERKAEVERFYLVDEDPPQEMHIEDTAEDLLNMSKIDKVKDLLGKIGEECQSILVLFYYQNLSLRDIGNQVGIEDEKIVKSKKFRCINRLRELLKTSN